MIQKVGTITYYDKNGNILTNLPLFPFSHHEDRINIINRSIESGRDDLKNWSHYSLHNSSFGLLRSYGDIEKITDLYITVDLKTGKFKKNKLLNK